MGLSLQDAMKLGRFSECEVVAGHEGMGRIIENVTIMEVPELAPWLKGGELILTSLFSIKDDRDAQNMLVHNLYKAGSIALAVKPFQTLKGIPEGILKSANKLGFPVIRIPEDIKYLDIMSPVMHSIVNNKVVLQEDIEQVTKVLNEVSLNAHGVDAFVENVQYLTKNVITIESEFSYIQVPSPEKDISPLTKDQKYELSIIQRPIQYERTYDDKEVSCLVAPIMVDGNVYGNITSWAINDDHSAMSIAIIEKASSLLSLEFLKLKVKYDVEQQYKSDFIRELLFSERIKENDVIEWGEKYRITKTDDYVCLLVSAKDKKSQVKNYIRLKDSEVNSIIQKIQPDVLAGHIRNGVCVILPTNGSSIKNLSQKIFDALSTYLGTAFTLSVGVGRSGRGPEGIQASFIQAEQALNLSETIRDTKGIIYYDDLGAYRLLNPLKGQKELMDFYEETVGKLVEQDTDNELLKTLRMYFYYDEVMKVTANALFIHVNTLKYRMTKIESITGYDLKSSEGKMNLFLGLKIHELTNRHEK